MTLREDSYIVIKRIMMEDNIFEPSTSTRHYRTIPEEVPEIYVLSKRRLQAIRAASTTGLMLIVLQAICGVMSNSLCVIADAARLFADFIEQHKYSQIDTPFIRKFEIVAIFGSAIAILVINTICVVFAMQRAYWNNFPIVVYWMLAGAIASITTNAILIYVHAKSEWHTRKRIRLSDMWSNKRAQFLHGTINHGMFGMTVLVCAVLVYYGFPLADSIGTYVTTAFAVANVASAVIKVNREYKTFKFFQEGYDSIADPIVY